MIRRITLVFFATIFALSGLFVGMGPAQAVNMRQTPDPGVWMTTGVVYASALSEDGKTLYIGGKFSQVREKPTGQGGKTLAVNNLAAIDVSTGAAIATWKPAVAGDSAVAPVVRSLAVKNGQVYVGGKFTSVAGQPRTNIASVDGATGAVKPMNARVGDGSSTVFAITPSGQNLLVGGKFLSVNGTSRQNLALVNATTGALDANWKTRANGTVHDIKPASDGGTTVFVGGGFTTVKGSNGVTEARQSIARVDLASGNVDPWAIPAGVIDTPMIAWDMIVTGGRLHVAFGEKPNYAASFRLDNGNEGTQVWRFGFVGNPQALAMSPDNSKLIIGGHFGINPLDQQVCGDKYLKGIVAVNPANGAIDCTWVPTLDQKTRPSYNGAWTMQTIGDYTWVGGGFIGVSGVAQSNLARFTLDPSFRPVNYSKPKVDLDGFGRQNGQQRGGLNATYFDNLDFTGPEVSRTDPTVDFDFGGGAPDPSMGSDTYSARWTGRVEAPVTGDYTFTTNSDDGVRLYVDGNLVVENWTNHGPTDDSGTVSLEAGQTYHIRLDYYEDGGGAVARLMWAYPGQDRQIIPSHNLLFEAVNAGGLDAEYFDTVDLTGPSVNRVDRHVNFDFGNGSPHPSIGPDTYSARWTGQVEAPVTGDYTFTTTADDGVRLFVDGKQLVENWSDRAPADDSGTITLEAGRRYDIQMDYYENGGGAVARLAWEYPGQGRQIVPSASLLTSGNTDHAATFSGGPTQLTGGNVAVFDADDANMRSATITLANNPDGAAEKLDADVAGTAISKTYDAATGTLSLTGRASKADYEKVLRSVTYDNTAADPTAGDRRVTFTVNDAFDDSPAAVSRVTVG